MDLEAEPHLFKILSSTSPTRGEKTLFALSLHLYTCQLFLRKKREIFVLGVLGFSKTTVSFPKIPEEVRSLPKTSEVC